jgi:glycosyltransferase involved in cell wall biosynthesis
MILSLIPKSRGRPPFMSSSRAASGAMPRRVLLLSLQLDQGGSERQLAEMAIGLDRGRYAPHVGTFRPQGMRADDLHNAGVPLLHFPVPSFRSLASLKAAWRLAQFVRQNKIDLVHAFDAPLTSFATGPLRLLTRAAVVGSQRNHRALTPEYRRILRLTDRLVHRIVVNCEYVRRHLIDDEGVPPALIKVCYNGLDLARFPDQPVPARPEVLQGARRVVGTLCRLRPEKDLTTLLSAFAGLEPARNNLRLAFVGSGTEREVLERQAADLRITEQCVFEPATANIGPWLRHMDVFVMPSRDEAFSNSIMEAMACGCAVVASNVGGNPELVTHEQTGLLFRAGDVGGLRNALTRLIGDDAQRATLARNGQTFVRDNLSRRRAADRLADIYDDVLANRRV